MSITDIIYFVQQNAVAFGQIVTSLIGIASLIVKMTPTLKDDTYLKQIVKFIGKFIALNHSVDSTKQKVANKKGIAF